MSSNTLPIKQYPAKLASQIANDSEDVAGDSVADALDTLSGLIGGSGNVTGPSPSTTDAIAAYADTTGEVLENTTFILHKVTTLASVQQHKAEMKAWWDVLFTMTYGATSTLDMDAAVFHKLTLTGNTILAFDRHTIGEMIVLLLKQDSTGGRSVTWPGSPVVINWDNNREPVLDPRPNGTDLIILRCVGEDVYGNAIYEEECRKTSAPRLGISTATDGATVTLNLDVSPAWEETLGGSRTLALAGTIVKGDVFSLKLRQDATGSRLATWWSGITWAGGSPPTLSTGANASDWFGFICTGSDTYDGFVLGQGL